MQDSVEFWCVADFAVSMAPEWAAAALEVQRVLRECHGLAGLSAGAAAEVAVQEIGSGLYVMSGGRGLTLLAKPGDELQSFALDDLQNGECLDTCSGEPESEVLTSMGSEGSCSSRSSSRLPPSPPGSGRRDPLAGLWSPKTLRQTRRSLGKFRKPLQAKGLSLAAVCARERRFWQPGCS